MCFVSFWEGAFAASSHVLSEKWTWLFQNPATITFPEQSMTRTEAGSFTPARVPTAAILPPEVSTAAFEMGGRPRRRVYGGADKGAVVTGGNGPQGKGENDKQGGERDEGS